MLSEISYVSLYVYILKERVGKQSDDGLCVIGIS